MEEMGTADLHNFSGSKDRCGTNAAASCEDMRGDSVREEKEKVGWVQHGNFLGMARAALSRLQVCGKMASFLEHSKNSYCCTGV